MNKYKILFIILVVCAVAYSAYFYIFVVRASDMDYYQIAITEEEKLNTKFFADSTLTKNLKFNGGAEVMNDVVVSPLLYTDIQIFMYISPAEGLKEQSVVERFNCQDSMFVVKTKEQEIPVCDLQDKLYWAQLSFGDKTYSAQIGFELDSDAVNSDPVRAQSYLDNAKLSLYREDIEEILASIKAD